MFECLNELRTPWVRDRNLYHTGVLSTWHVHECNANKTD